MPFKPNSVLLHSIFLAALACVFVLLFLAKAPLREPEASTISPRTAAPRAVAPAPRRVTDVVERSQPTAKRGKPGFHHVKKPGSEPAWAVIYGEEFWRTPAPLRVKTGGAPFDVHSSIDRVRHAFGGDANALDVKGATFAVDLDGKGFRFSPYQPNSKGAQVQNGVALHASTAAIRSGATSLYRAGQPLEWAINGNIAQAALSPESGIVEHYDVRNDGVSVTWIFNEKPDLAQDVEIEWSLTGMQIGPRTASGQHYLDGAGKARVRAGNATAVDARGMSTSLQTETRNGNVVIRIPRALIEKSGFPLAIDPTVSAEYELDTPIISPDADQNALAAVSSNGADYFVLWTEGDGGSNPFDIYGLVVGADGDHSTVPISICSASGNQNSVVVTANDSGSWLVVWLDTRSGTNDVYGALVDSFGMVQTVADGVAICAATGSQSSPTVASVGNEWLVAWSDPRTASGDIYGATIDSSGAPQQTDGFIICTATGQQRLPVAQGNGTSYYVIWEDKRTSSFGDVYGNLVSTSGTVADTSGTAICTAADTQTALQLASTGTEWLAAWHDKRTLDSLNHDIYGRTIDGGGTPGTEFVIVDDPSNQTYPSLASNGTDYFVAWTDARFSNDGDIFGTLISQSGIVATADGAVICDASDSTQIRQVANSGENWMVIWKDERTGDGNVYGAIVDSSGNSSPVDGFALTSDVNDQYAAQLAGNGTNWLVCWIDARNLASSNEDVYGALVSASQVVEPLDGTPIALAANTEEEISIASNGSTWFAAWTDNRNQTTTGLDIYGMMLDACGCPITTDGIAIATVADDQEGPAVGASGSNYLVAWENQNAADPTVRAATVDANGDVSANNGFEVSNPPSTNEPSDLDVDGNGSEWLVNWSHSSGLDGAIISSAGAITSSLSFAGAINSADAAACGNDWLVAWCPAANEARYSVVHPNGSLSPDDDLLADGAGTEAQIRVASSSTGWITAWTDTRNGNADIYAVLFDTAGAITAADTAVCTETSAQSTPALASNDAGTLIAWTDARADASGDIYGAILIPSGVVQQANGFSIASGTDAQTAPEVATEGADWLVAWQSGTLVDAAVVESGATVADLAMTGEEASGPRIALGPNNQFLVAFEGHNSDGQGIWTGTDRAAAQIVDFRQTQTIDFTEIPDQAYSAAAITLVATASSTLPVTFTVGSGPATVLGNQLTLTGIGEVTVWAGQAGDENYQPASSAQTFTVSKQSQSISFAAISTKEFSSNTFAISATSNRGLTVSYGVASGPAVLSGNRVRMTGLGTVILVASNGGNSVTNAANASNSFRIVDTTDPSISIKSRFHTSGGSKGISGILKDNHDITKIKYRIKGPDGNFGRYKTDRFRGTDDQRGFHLSIPTPNPGTYTVELIAFDQAGNRGEKKVTIVREE